MIILKKYRTKLFLAMLFGTTIMSVNLQGQDLEMEFLQRMKKANEEIYSIESDFIQERTISIMEEVLRSSGKFYYKKPD